MRDIFIEKASSTGMDAKRIKEIPQGINSLDDDITGWGVYHFKTRPLLLLSRVRAGKIK